MNRDMTSSAVPTVAARQCIVILAVIAACLLLVADEGIEGHWQIFDSVALKTVWYTLSIALPLVVGLMLMRVGEAFIWLASAALSLLLILSGWHTGGACGDAGSGAVHAPCSPVISPYIWAITVGLFILLPFIQTLRDNRGDGLEQTRLPYESLYQYAWDNALALAGTMLFAGLAWAILLLWAALFKLIGIDFFETLFDSSRFRYPVGGLLLGFGMILSRAQPGALRAVLRLCLSLSRALLPLIAMLAIVFITALAFTGLAPLWATRHAASLLLSLVFGVVVLANGVFQDGHGDARYPVVVRWAISAALLSLPLYAALAGYALALRVQQHGWSVDRLWAAVLVAIAALHALSTAIATISRRDKPWLGLLRRFNPAIAGIVVAILLLTQSPLLNLRAIASQSQLARVAGGHLAAADLDLHYFRFELGRPGSNALAGLRNNPAFAGDPSLAKRIDELLASKNPWESEHPAHVFTADQFRVVPEATAVPPALIDAINAELASLNRVFLVTIADGGKSDSTPVRSVLLQADLDDDGKPEWLVLFSPKTQVVSSQLIFAGSGADWHAIATLDGDWNASHWLDDIKALEDGRYRVQAPHWRDLVIDGSVHAVRPMRPKPEAR